MKHIATGPTGPKTVLYVSFDGDLMAGAEAALFGLATGLASHGWSPLVAVPVQGALARPLIDAAVPVHVGELGILRNRHELRSPKLLWRLATTVPAAVRLAALIRRTGVRIVHSNTSVVLAGALAARLTGTPHVWHVREIFGGPAWRVLRRIILALSDRVVCISTAVADNVAPPGSPQRARVVIIPGGADLSHFSTPRPLEVGDKLRVGMIGRINPWKGQELFLRAAHLVAQRVPDVEFFMVGGYIAAHAPLYRRLLAIRSALGLEEQVHFIEHLDRDAVRDFMASLDVFVLPSTKPEPQGLVVVEAMALSRPIVATRQGGPLDMITHGVNGLLVSPDGPIEMADAITALLRNPSLRQELGAAARRRAEAEYTLDLEISHLTALYDKLAA